MGLQFHHQDVMVNPKPMGYFAGICNLVINKAGRKLLQKKKLYSLVVSKENPETKFYLLEQSKGMLKPRFRKDIGIVSIRLYRNVIPYKMGDTFELTEFNNSEEHGISINLLQKV